MRDENQCLHGRDAHAPLAFASHTLSSHFRISESAKKIGADDLYRPLPVFSTLPIDGKPPRSQHYDVEDEPLVMSPLNKVLGPREQ